MKKDKYFIKFCEKINLKNILENIENDLQFVDYLFKIKDIELVKNFHIFYTEQTAPEQKQYINNILANIANGAYGDCLYT
ncbi:MAG: hypothetical protein ULS35scaffold63_66 [Phage 33_17]|nr:MAG: hypothetical protein ULS35scaffold63_66 [Phage 33_17]